MHFQCAEFLCEAQSAKHENYHNKQPNLIMLYISLSIRHSPPHAHTRTCYTHTHTHTHTQSRHPSLPCVSPSLPPLSPNNR